MKFKSKLSIGLILLAVVLIISSVWAASTLNYMAQGGRRWVVGGTLDFTGVNAAGGSANPIDYTGTLGIMDGTGSDLFQLIDVNLTNANHTGGTAEVINVANITGDANATENAINIGTGWDAALTTGSPIASTSTLSVDGVATIDCFKFGAVVANTDASETLSATQTGALVTCSAAGGVTTITLPDPSASTVGVVYYIFQQADQTVDIVPTTANGNSIVSEGVATSDKVTLTHASNKIGAACMVVGISATKWWVGGFTDSTLTVEAAD